MKTYKTKNKTKLALFAGATALAALAPQVHAQSSDALIDKLVDKGVLTVDEAKDLRTEADKDFNTAMQAKTGMPDYVTGYKISGDVRGRYENFSYDAASPISRDRFRYRIRAGITVYMKDDVEAGFRITSDEAKGSYGGGDPISGNQTMTDNGSKKLVYIDQAYGKWSPLHTAGWNGSVILGKMENPFVYSDLVFDPDYTPEGAALQLSYDINDRQKVSFNGGGFALYEISGSYYDSYMFGGQARLDSKWTDKLTTSVGAGYLCLANDAKLTTAAVPDSNSGNTRVGGVLVHDYTPFVLDASATYNLDSIPFYSGPFPIKVAGDYINNSSVNKNGDGFSAGITLGKAGKKGLWELSYRFKYLKSDAWYEELVDSDFGANTSGSYKSGTNVKGHVVKVVYNLTDSLSLASTLFITSLVSKPTAMKSHDDTSRLQVDANWKF
jgi:hypothetical protein